MSKLSFRARALDAAKPLPVYRHRDLPDLSDCVSISRAVPQMPTGMEKEEELVGGGLTLCLCVCVCVWPGLGPGPGPGLAPGPGGIHSAAPHSAARLRAEATPLDAPRAQAALAA